METYYVTPETGIRIKYKGVIDLDRLYHSLKDWMEEQGYGKEATLEKKYAERIKPDGKQLEITWETEKKFSDYFTYKLRVDFLILGMNDVEVAEGGFKKKLQKMRLLEIKITAYISYSSGKWESLGPFSKIYFNLISRQRLKQHYQDFYDKVYAFQEEIKKFLGLRI